MPSDFQPARRPARPHPKRVAPRGWACSLLAACSAVFAAPVAGERHQVDGRCVTLTRVAGGQAYYAWREGQRSGSGNLPASDLGARCEVQPPARGSQPQAEMQDQGGAVADSPGMAPPAAPPSVAMPTAGAAAGDDAAFRDEILRAHNQFRCMHGVPALSWQPEMAAYAQQWVGRGVFDHSDSYHSPLGPMGENVYGSSGQPSASAAVRGWYDESRDYVDGREGAGGTGHFTALIWKDVKYVGCARANGMISCNYGSRSPANDCSVPNMQGCYRQQVLPRVKDEAACR